MLKNHDTEAIHHSCTMSHIIQFQKITELEQAPWKSNLNILESLGQGAANLLLKGQTGNS